MKHRAPVAWRKSLRHRSAETCFSEKLYSSASRHRFGDLGDSFEAARRKDGAAVAFGAVPVLQGAKFMPCVDTVCYRYPMLKQAVAA